MGKICKYPVGGGINEIWCYTPFSGIRLDTATIVIMFGHPTERQRMGRDIRAWCCLFPRSRHLISSSNYQQEFPPHRRVTMAVTQYLISRGKLVVTLCSSWYTGLFKAQWVCIPAAHQLRSADSAVTSHCLSCPSCLVEGPEA